MNRVVIESASYPNCRVEFEIAYTVKTTDEITVLSIRSGAVRLQTYATRDELRALGEMLLRHADEGEVLEVVA